MKTKREKQTEDLLLSQYSRYYRLAYSYVHNEQDALDIVQESAYKAMRDCRSVQNDAYLGTWLYRIVINTALEFLRKHKREDTVEEVTEPLTAAVGDYTNELAQLHSKWELEEMLEHLNDREKSVIILRFFEDRGKPEHRQGTAVPGTAKTAARSGAEQNLERSVGGYENTGRS